MEKIINDLSKLIDENALIVLVLALVSLFLLCKQMNKMKMEFMADGDMEKNPIINVAVEDMSEPGLADILKDNTTAAFQFYGLEACQCGISSSIICCMCIGMASLGFKAFKKP
jgi:hypothetical protein